MKLSFSNLFAALLKRSARFRPAGCLKAVIAQSQMHGFTILPIQSLNNISTISRTMDKQWLVFLCLVDRHDDASLHILQAGENVSERILDQAVTGTTIFIGKVFFSPKERKLVDCALHDFCSPISYPLSALQRDDLFWIIEKFQEVAHGDYLFRVEYLQQLLLQVVHFALKNFSACKSNDEIKYPSQQNLSHLLFERRGFLAN